jgi:hypothetical protein
MYLTTGCLFVCLFFLVHRLRRTQTLATKKVASLENKARKFVAGVTPTLTPSSVVPTRAQPASVAASSTTTIATTSLKRVASASTINDPADPGSLRARLIHALALAPMPRKADRRESMNQQQSPIKRELVIQNNAFDCSFGDAGSELAQTLANFSGNAFHLKVKHLFVCFVPHISSMLLLLFCFFVSMQTELFDEVDLGWREYSEQDV